MISWSHVRQAEGRRLIRVFPRRTKATPDDELAYTGPPDFFAEADEVHKRPREKRRR